MKKLLLETVCPHCQTELSHDDWIDLKIRLSDGREGNISLSAYFCDYSLKTPFFIEEGAVADFFCPRCGADLVVDRPCGECGVPQFSLGIKTGGVIDVCRKKGCPGHAMGGFGDPDTLIMLLNKLVDTPYL